MKQVVVESAKGRYAWTVDNNVNYCDSLLKELKRLKFTATDITKAYVEDIVDRERIIVEDKTRWFKDRL